MWEGRTGKYLARIYNARAEKAQKRFCSKVLTFFFHSEQEDNNLSKNATFLISGFFSARKLDTFSRNGSSGLVRPHTRQLSLWFSKF